jgi:tetratricopeptide (TPR) repeat protein
MRVAFLFGLLTVLLAGPVRADGYSVLNAGIAARNSGETDEAIRLLSQAIAAPDLPPGLLAVAYLDRGESYLAKAQPDLALADSNATIAAQPDSFEAFVLRAAIYRSTKKYDLAIADITSAIAIRPDLPNAYFLRASAYESRKNFDAATADLAAIVAIDSSQWRAYFMRSNIYRFQKKYDLALADIDKAMDLNSKVADVYFARAQIYQDTGNNRDALSDLIAGIGYAPTSYYAHLQMGLLQWNAGSFDDAATAVTQAVALKPSYAYGVLWLAISKLKTGKPNDDFAANAAKLDAAKWPAPIMKVYLGTATPDQAVLAANQGGADALQGQKCEANFYIGEWQVLHQNAVAAKPMFEAAASSCPVGFIEQPAAAAELKRMS